MVQSDRTTYVSLAMVVAALAGLGTDGSHCNEVRLTHSI